MNLLYRSLTAVIITALPIINLTSALAGSLILQNTSNSTITCTVDGWTVASGNNADKYYMVLSKQSVTVPQNTNRTGPPIINWARCKSLQTRAMAITPDGPDQKLVLNGQQMRVLNVSLYSFLPTLPNDKFEDLVNYIVATYQTQNPQVLLNAVLNQDVNIYDFSNLPTLLGSEGYDVMEIDVLYLGFLADNNLINPASITGDPPLEVALAGATYKNKLWAIPSWLCMDFLYSYDQAIKNQTSLSQLVDYLGTLSSSIARLVGSFNGSWAIPADYINVYVQTYGYNNLNQAFTMPPDDNVIKQLVLLSDTCTFSGENNCTNNTYHSAANGNTEKIFAEAQSSTDIGFSEQSFFINLYSPTPKNIYITPVPWGQTPQPLLFQDAFVTSSNTCSPLNNLCVTDAQAFTDLMTATAMKNYIVQSTDLPQGSPRRTLLVANSLFWNQPQIKNDGYYSQLWPVVSSAKAFPNNFTAQIQSNMANEICVALKNAQPAYVCKTNNTAASLSKPHFNKLTGIQNLKNRKGL